MQVRVKLYQIITLLLSAWVASACSDHGKLFTKEEASDAGIAFENKLQPTDDFNIIDYLYFYNGGGVSIGDVNGDTLPDLFFSGNQVKNKLYINEGGLKFTDVTEKAGVGGNSTWNTGSIMGDVNGDGLLDIYVCAVVGLKNLRGHNELFINNGDGTFSEQSEEFGLDFDTYSSSAAFLDYDLDGDLDVYLLNHAVHTAGSFGDASLRNQKSYESGDKLLRNDGGKFVDVSDEAKIFGGVNGYGLGITVSDFNVDGYPDIYVGNDFHEDDYLYINNGDGTFSEKLKSSMTQTSRFSMGNDAADINHDGYPDLISLDMLPQDEEILKRSEGDEGIQTLKMRTRQYGYYYQFVRNMLQVNQGNGTFIETGLLSNVAATDWSWSALFSDFDQDGNQDLFISNGIPRRPNDLDYIKYVSSKQVVNTMGVTKLMDQKALALMPSGVVENYIYRGSGGFQFEDMTEAWLPDEKTCSTAAAVGDLDNDGDLDIVVNNVEAPPGIYINHASESSKFLKIRFDYKDGNRFGIGSKVYAYTNGELQFKEMFNVRGFQASSEPVVHFGLGVAPQFDSLIVIWPDGSKQKLLNVAANQTITVKFDANVVTETSGAKPRNEHPQMFEQMDPSVIGLDFTHQEDSYTDFDRLKLLPYQQSDRGPATAVGDLNNDGRVDLFFGGSKRVKSRIYVQTDDAFRIMETSLKNDSINEDVEAVIEDFDNDGRSEIFVGTGGADFYNQAEPLLDRYYKTTSSGLESTTVEGYYENASCLKVADFDNDGDQDLFVGNESVSNDFGRIPKSYLLKNEHGVLKPYQPEIFENLGMVTDAVWTDYNTDGQLDLIVVGAWMAPVFLKNDQGKFSIEKVAMEALNGLWQSVAAFDIDDDGKEEYLLGNWGLNSKYRASKEAPVKMFYDDFDGDGKSETIVAINKGGKYYPLEPLDMLASQIISLHKKFTSYQAFGGKAVEEIFDREKLAEAKVYELEELASGYLDEQDGGFTFKQFPLELQLAPILTFLQYDFNNDGKDEVLAGGNYFGVQPFYGRYGSFGGALISSDKNILSGKDIGLNFFNKSVRHLNVINVGGENYLLATIHDDRVQTYKIKSR